jgi:hypothetical protein
MTMTVAIALVGASVAQAGEPWQHPFMAPNGANNLHNDAYMSDYYPDIAPPSFGPRSTVKQVTWSRETGHLGLCATHTFEPERGNLLTACIDPTVVAGPTDRVVREGDIQLVLLDAATLEVLAYESLGLSSPNSFGGGGYFYMNDEGLAVIGRDGLIVTRGVRYDPAPALVAGPSYPLVDGEGAAILDAGVSLGAVLPDDGGRLWWVTEGSDTSPAWVGFVDPVSGVTQALQLDEIDGEMERIVNSMAVDGGSPGGVYVVSTHRIFRFEAEHGEIVPTWQTGYDRGGRAKPGQVSQGSGTTPTLLDVDGERLMAVVDNADPYMQLLVYRRNSGDLLCKVPLFTGYPRLAGRTATENAVVALDHAFLIENNHGYSGVSAVRGPRTTTPGLSKVEVEISEEGISCWETATTIAVAAPSVVPKAAGADPMLYVYNKRVAGWFLTQLDANTLDVVSSLYIGGSGPVGVALNNHYAPITLRPDGVAYIGQMSGMLRIEPR